MAAITIKFIDTHIPFPFSRSKTSIPLVVYVPVLAAFISTWEMSLWVEPFDRLSIRPIRLLDTLLLIGITSWFALPMLMFGGTGGSELAYTAARNFSVGIWLTITLNIVLGIRRGAFVSVLGFLFVPTISTTGTNGESPWWYLSEAPYDSARTLLLTAVIILLGMTALLLSGRRFDASKS